MTKILVIDDEEMLRTSIAEILKRKQFDVVTAENGRIGVEVAKKEMPDLIICDVQMPELNGFDVLVNLRGTPNTVHIPFIFLTAQTDKEDFRKGMGLGADDYLTKPFEISDLLTAVETRLEKHAATTKKMEDLRLNISAMLPHELRTPLTGILGASQLLMNSFIANPEPEFVRNMGEMIHSSGLRLQSLIENYLLYAQLKLQEYTPNKERALTGNQLCSIQEVIQTFSMNQAEKVNRAEDISLIIIDATTNMPMEYLKKIIEELVGNALKFSKPGTPITIKTTIEDNTCVLSIADQGHGMTAQQISEIGAYRQFEREEHEQQGSGLGLALVKLLAQLYGGDMTVESQPNQGTTIVVTFKLIS